MINERVADRAERRGRGQAHRANPVPLRGDYSFRVACDASKPGRRRSRFRDIDAAQAPRLS